MYQSKTRVVKFALQPDLLSKHLGSDLYPSPNDALCQLVANSLDAGCSHVGITIELNELGGPQLLVITDDGRGISPAELDQAYTAVGRHFHPAQPKREVIGSRGIGRFAVHALAAQSTWMTIAESEEGKKICQRWTLAGHTELRVQTEPARSLPTGTKITIVPKQVPQVTRLLGSTQVVKRQLFNSFAGYLLRYRDEVVISVNGEKVDVEEYVDHSEIEDIEETDTVPAASLNHLLLSSMVDQQEACVLQFATHGSTISARSIEGEKVPGRKYLGLVDSAYLSDLTNTAKSELASMDPKFQALEAEATDRAKRYITKAKGDRFQTFLEEARAKDYYPYKNPPQTLAESYSKGVFEALLVNIEEGFGISRLLPRQQQLTFLLVKQLLQSEDLASILTEVLQLKGDNVTKFAELLRSTSLASIISVSELLVNRFQFLEELRTLVYGQPAKYVKERRHLHKIIEGHTWLFGEQYNLMGSDISLKNLLPIIMEEVGDVDGNGEADIEIDQQLKDIPDLYLLANKWNEGAKYHQHLVVELKRPSVRIATKHIDQLQRYAREIVKNPIFRQNHDSHRFTFVLVSSQVADLVKEVNYQDGTPPGLLGKPANLGHPTELWALQWSDFIDQRQEEMRFLRDKIEITADPNALAYLRSIAGDNLPEELTPALQANEV